MSTQLYKIVRNHFDSQRAGIKIVRQGLTLTQAREHCRNPETSARTCKRAENVKYTEDHGSWFDSYEEM